MLCKITSAKLTRSGSMVIHTCAPFTVAQLICEESAIQASHRSIKWKGDLLKPTLELDVPWHGVVVHGIPAAPLGCLEWQWPGHLDNLLWDNGILPGNVKDVRILCWDEEVELRSRCRFGLCLRTQTQCGRYSVMASFCLAQGARCPSIITANGETAFNPHLLPHPYRAIHNLHQPQTTPLSYLLYHMGISWLR